LVYCCKTPKKRSKWEKNCTLENGGVKDAPGK